MRLGDGKFDIIRVTANAAAPMRHLAASTCHGLPLAMLSLR